ncbi:Gfo/Idh/MocA family oxidoreductase [Jannaschia sp. LMIT008]|uniref:Gfo/Idh/MocA family protein n=1 Tax=Jannaschia maritima TaxID=3032585 RepID=UPI002810B2B0|nr:Gfo/Idh/MocA family oxidoreductase [Jannaschia sp. LMIT008]
MEKTEDVLRIGLVGLGYFARFHRDAWNRLDGATLVAAADRDPETGADFADLGAMLDAHPIDVVDIATPPHTHEEAIMTALAARPRAIVCQKPFCSEYGQARDVVAAAEDAGVPLIVHENFRFQPWFRTMKAALDDGLVGRPLQLTFRLRTGDGRGPDAYSARQPYFRTMPRFLMHETGVHYVDTFRYLLGEPGGLYADLRRLNPAIMGEDAGLVVLEFADEMRAVLDANRLADFDADETRRTFGEALLEGEDGTIALTGDGAVTVRAHGTQARRTLLAARDWPGFAGDCVLAFQRHVLDRLNGRGPLETAARDYLRNLELVAATYASAERGARVEL